MGRFRSGVYFPGCPGEPVEHFRWGQVPQYCNAQIYYRPKRQLRRFDARARAIFKEQRKDVAAKTRDGWTWLPVPLAISDASFRELAQLVKDRPDEYSLRCTDGTSAHWFFDMLEYCNDSASRIRAAFDVQNAINDHMFKLGIADSSDENIAMIKLRYL